MPPQPQIIPVVVSPPGALYTAGFIPKYIDKSAATFALLPGNIVRIYNGSAQVAMELPLSLIHVKTYSKAMYNSLKVSLQGKDYIFVCDINFSLEGYASPIAIGSDVIEATNNFFKYLEQQANNPSSPQTIAAPITTPAQSAAIPSTTATLASAPGQQYTAMPSMPAVPTGAPDPVGSAIKDRLAKRAQSYIIVGLTILITSILGTVASYFTNKDGKFYFLWYSMLLGIILLVKGLAANKKLQ
jgi:hypothetical protein